jgi:hypothetical protein
MAITCLPTYLPILLPTLIHEIATRSLYLLFPASLPFGAGRDEAGYHKMCR